MNRVLVSNLMMLNERERFEGLLRAEHIEPIWPDVEQYLDEAACLELVGDIDGWLAGDDQISEKVLKAALPRLKVISKWGTGLDSIDLDSAKKLKVPVLNSPGAFAQAVAEVAVGYMLMLSRNLGLVDRSVRTGGWPKPQGRDLQHATTGLVGFGAIGRRIGEICSAFGSQVLFHDPTVTEPVAMLTGNAQPCSFNDLAKHCDFICLACNLSPSNVHMINDMYLQGMKTGAYLINVARGPLVDEQALLKALQGGRIAGAALDVFEVEPLAKDSPLLLLENVVLGSHNANNTFEAVEYVHANTISNLKKHLSP